MQSPPPQADRGAYGLRFRGLRGEFGLLGPAEDISHPVVTVLSDGAPPGPDVFVARITEAVSVAMERRSRTISLLGADSIPDTDALHRLASTAGIVFGHWAGRQPFHAGAFHAPTGAWAVLGGRGDGKSTLLAALARAGVPVLSDDTLVVHDGVVHAGPRCIDLREPAPRELGLSDRVVPVRAGTRMRYLGPPGPAEAPLRGWISLAWGDRVRLRLLPARDALRAVGSSRAWPMAEDARPYLDLSALPVYELTRPRSWARIGESVERVLEVAA